MADIRSPDHPLSMVQRISQLEAIIESKDGWKELWQLMQLQGERALAAETENATLRQELAEARAAWRRVAGRRTS